MFLPESLLWVQQTLLPRPAPSAAQGARFWFCRFSRILSANGPKRLLWWAVTLLGMPGAGLWDREVFRTERTPSL